MGSLADAVPPALAPPRKLRVTITGVHPGDPEYGCGGTIARYTDKNHEVVLLYLDDGVPVDSPQDGVRVSMARMACESLGARPLFAGQVDGDSVVDRPQYELFHK